MGYIDETMKANRDAQEKYSQVALLESDDSVASKDLAKSIRKIQNDVDDSVKGKGPYGSIDAKYVPNQVKEDYEAAVKRAFSMRERELEGLNEEAQKLQKKHDASKVDSPLGSDMKVKRHRDQERVKALAGMSDEEIEEEIYRYNGDEHHRESIEYLNELSKQARERKMKNLHERLRKTMQEANAKQDALHMTMDGLKLNEKIKRIQKSKPKGWQTNYKGSDMGIDLTWNSDSIDLLLDLSPLSMLKK